MTLDRRQFMLNTTAFSAVSLMPSVLSAASPAVTGSGVARPELLPDAASKPSRMTIDQRLWNWRMGEDFAASMPANYYEASLSDWADFGPLPADTVCDVAVIGGGLLGASAALHMAEAGLDVVLLERDAIGSGASGRNGGLITPGLARWEVETILARLSHDEAKRLWRFASADAVGCLDDITTRYDFSCDRKSGYLMAAAHAGHKAALIGNADARRYLGDDAVRMIGRQDLKDYIRSDVYHGAALDRLGGQVQPLALLRGLVYGFSQRGGRVYERTEVRKIEEAPAASYIITDYGTVRVRKAVVLAVHNATHEFLPGSRPFIPFFTYVGVTAPLPVDVRTFLPAGLPVYDTRQQMDYYRAVRKNRLLFSAQGTGNAWSPQDANRYLLERIRAVFPHLPEPELDYSWGGLSAVMPDSATDCHKSEAAVPVYRLYGWSGHGIAQTVRIGKAVSDDLTGREDDFTMLTHLARTQVSLGNYAGPVIIPLARRLSRANPVAVSA